MMTLRRFRCRDCSATWESTVHRQYRFCPNCGHMNVSEVSAPPGATYDGGGPRWARPVEVPAIGSLVQIRPQSDEVIPEAEQYWELQTVLEHYRSLSSLIQPSFRTAKGHEYSLVDFGKTWKDAPPEYARFLKSHDLSFEEFAKALARGGIEGVTGKIQGAVTDWGDHNANRYRGVAQEALRLLTIPLSVAEHALQQTCLELRRREGEMELARQILGGEQVIVGAGKISDEDLLSLTRKTP